jgi:hypothetical protein
LTRSDIRDLGPSAHHTAGTDLPLNRMSDMRPYVTLPGLAMGDELPPGPWARLDIVCGRMWVGHVCLEIRPKMLILKPQFPDREEASGDAVITRLSQHHRRSNWPGIGCPKPRDGGWQRWMAAADGHDGPTALSTSGPIGSGPAPKMKRRIRDGHAGKRSTGPAW